MQEFMNKWSDRANDTKGSRTCSVHMAICTISLKVEAMYLRGNTYDANSIVNMVDTFCDEQCEGFTSERWRAIAKGVTDKLVYWGVIEYNGTLVRR